MKVEWLRGQQKTGAAVIITSACGLFCIWKEKGLYEVKSRAGAIWCSVDKFNTAGEAKGKCEELAV